MDGKGTKINPRWWFYCLCISSQLSSSKQFTGIQKHSLHFAAERGGCSMQGGAGAVSCPGPRGRLPHPGTHQPQTPTTARTQLQYRQQRGPCTVPENEEKRGIGIITRKVFEKSVIGLWFEMSLNILKYTSLKVSFLLTVITSGYVVGMFLNTWFIFPDLCCCFCLGLFGFLLFLFIYFVNLNSN